MIAEPNCRKRGCKHFIGVFQVSEDEETETVNCSAFPEGIPAEIAYGDNLHSEPLPDQNNDIIFEKE